MTQNDPLISVCIISRGSGPPLAACLRSLKDQSEAPAFEVLVGSRLSAQVEGEVRSLFPDAVVDQVPHTMPGSGRNVLIERAAGEVLLFLDDDVEAHPELLARLASLLHGLPEVAVFGGPNLTPRGSSRFQVLQGAVLGSIVTSGPVRRRYGRHPPGTADERSLILCNLAIRRDVMRPFEADLACAEENQLLLQLEGHGVQMLYDPELIVYHQRRETLRGFVRQIYKYGYGRGQVIRRNPASFRVSYVVPAATLLYVGLIPALWWASPWILAPLAAYSVLVAAAGARIALSLRKAGAWASASGLVALVHGCYGAGVLAGLGSSASARPNRRSEAVIEADAQAFETTRV